MSIETRSHPQTELTGNEPWLLMLVAGIYAGHSRKKKKEKDSKLSLQDLAQITGASFESLAQAHNTLETWGVLSPPDSGDGKRNLLIRRHQLNSTFAPPAFLEATSKLINTVSLETDLKAPTIAAALGLITTTSYFKREFFNPIFNNNRNQSQLVQILRDIGAAKQVSGKGNLTLISRPDLEPGSEFLNRANNILSGTTPTIRTGPTSPREKGVSATEPWMIVLGITIYATRAQRKEGTQTISIQELSDITNLAPRVLRQLDQTFRNWGVVTPASVSKRPKGIRTSMLELTSGSGPSGFYSALNSIVDPNKFDSPRTAISFATALGLAATTDTLGYNSLEFVVAGNQTRSKVINLLRSVGAIGPKKFKGGSDSLIQPRDLMKGSEFLTRADKILNGELPPATETSVDNKAVATEQEDHQTNTDSFELAKSAIDNYLVELDKVRSVVEDLESSGVPLHEIVTHQISVDALSGIERLEAAAHNKQIQEWQGLVTPSFLASYNTLYANESDVRAYLTQLNMTDPHYLMQAGFTAKEANYWTPNL